MSRIHLRWRIFAALAFAVALQCGAADGGETRRIHVNGVDLSYIEQGSGEPVILLHGALGDLSSWQSQMDALSPKYRAVSYSRRYSFPNTNAYVPPNYSALIDAEDLAALISSLGLHHVRLVGQSYGGFVALAYTLRHRDRVLKLVMSEPPVHQLIRASAAGEAAYQDFMARIMRPAADSFRGGDERQAMSVFVDGMLGANRFEGLPPETLAIIMRSAPSVRALILSTDPFPLVAKADLAKLRVPALILTGGSIRSWRASCHAQSR
jgi:pimeloyl-ACP methyl ester carboxylesterase